MGKSLYLGTYAGIPIYVHWTFGFIILFIIYSAVADAMKLEAMFWFSLSILSLFFCVILHEYGHALMARRYGVKTRDIIISPIGGVARMEDMPDKPWKEIIIAIAGPLVNVVLLLVLGLIFYFIIEYNHISISDIDLMANNAVSYLGFLIIINFSLFVFNLVPAFPMDGGRVLRALLAMKWGRVRATRIASAIGRILAVAFIGLAIWFNHPTLGFIGVFIYYMATMEMRQVDIKSKLIDTKLSDIMERNYTILFTSDSIQKLRSFYTQDIAKNFLVFDESQRPVGCLPELYIKEYLEHSENDETLLGDIMSRSFGYFDQSENLDAVFNKMNKNGWSIAGIKNGDQLIAVVDRHIINSFLKASS